MIKTLRALAASALLLVGAIAPQASFAQAFGTVELHALSSCGTSPSATSFSEITPGGYQRIWGVVTTGTGSPTGCVLTFAHPFKKAPVCQLQDSTVAANLTSFAVTNTAVTVVNTGASSQALVYECFGNQ